jgi:hypothetical protein
LPYNPQLNLLIVQELGDFCAHLDQYQNQLARKLRFIREVATGGSKLIGSLAVSIERIHAQMTAEKTYVECILNHHNHLEGMTRHI